MLSEGFAVAWGCLLLFAVDGSCAWRGLDEARACWVRAGYEQEKGIGWMPWRQEAMKDVARCENPGEAASGR